MNNYRHTGRIPFKKCKGWYNGNTLYSYSMTKQITMGDKDMLLVAKSNPISYKIAYNLDGGTYGTSHLTSADYDTMVTIDNPSKKDMYLNGGKYSYSSFNGQYFLKKFYPLS